MKSWIKINVADNVIVCLTDLQKGEMINVDGQHFEVLQDTPRGHKIAICNLKKGDNVIKYGYPIGHLTENVMAGQWLNENNIHTNLEGLLDYEYKPVNGQQSTDNGQQTTNNGVPTFKGYKRKNGDVGIRNDIWVIPTVGCVNGVCYKITELFNAQCKGDVRAIAYGHNYGCSQLSDDHENTKKILRDMVLHPNAGAVLVVGLGCENNQPDVFREFLGDYDKERIRFMVCQEVEGNEVEYGLKIMHKLEDIVNKDCRENIELSHLRVGLKCGGSDGLSGITANPLVGEFSDYLVANGGTSILTEVPEMFGAETILMNRCKTEDLFNKTVKMINDFKQYYLSHGEPVGENPSPGNKKGGISTLEDKALGCTQKCGKALVSGVLEYGERLKNNGLNLLSAPGNDLVAATALAASGCHIVLFTTGRGTPFGTFVPTMKISTNSVIFKNKPDWIDFNAGQLVDGREMDDVVKDLTEKIISIASGEKTKNEENGYHEISIFKNGVTL